MQTKFWNSMKNLVKNSIALSTFLVALSAFGKDVPIERDFLTLPNGRWVWLKKTGWDTTKVMVGKGLKRERNATWARTFESSENRSWEYAYFVRLKPNTLAIDLDGDGNFEVGISTYDMGNNMIRRIMLFSVVGSHLVFVREHGPFNIAADESVFN